MRLEERAFRGRPVDIALFDIDFLLLQKTSGVSAGGSSGFPVKHRFGHEPILRLKAEG
jgi:hypothetical protein